MKLNLSDPMNQFASAPKRKIALPNTHSKIRAEESLVTAYTTWFKLQYPGLPYQINSKEQKRSYAAQNVLKKQEFKSGVPDLQLDVAAHGFHSFRLEFKKDWDELFTVKGLLRPGSYGHFYQQDDYHAILEKHGHFVTFVWDLDQATILTLDYFAGRLDKRPIYERSQPDYDYEF